VGVTFAGIIFLHRKQGWGGVRTDLKQEVNFSGFSTPRISRVIGVEVEVSICNVLVTVTSGIISFPYKIAVLIGTPNPHLPAPRGPRHAAGVHMNESSEICPWSLGMSRHELVPLL